MTETTKVFLVMLAGLALLVGVAVFADFLNGDDGGTGDVVSVVR